MADTSLKKNRQGYGYKYTDLAQIHEYLENNNITYYQYIERDEGDDYIFTVPIIDGKEQSARRGCRVVQATLSGKSNPAQEQGSALTYARRYSLLMAFGLATEDDDGESLTKKEEPKITKVMEDSLREGIKNCNIGNEKALEVLKKYNYTKLSEIKLADVTKIRNEILGD
mgnify:CR=1 FL=1